MQDQTRRVSSQHGFSLMELTIALLVVAIIIAFALPAVSNSVRAYNLRSSADHLAERISAVRALAMAKNRNVTFSLNNGSRQYGFDFTGPDGDGVPDSGDPEDPTIAGYYIETLPTEVSATFPDSAPIRITFNSRGEMPIGAAAQSIAIGSYGNSMVVDVSLRGKITVR